MVSLAWRRRSRSRARCDECIGQFGVSATLSRGGGGSGDWIAQDDRAGLWPTQWPLVTQLVPALLLGELVEYTVHRAMHENAWLWAIHAPHHSATRLYWLNAVHFHPIGVRRISPGKLIPLVALGANLEVMGLVLNFAAVHGSCQHANIPCRVGPLNWVFSIAELHRWHHSPHVVEADHSYGGNLIFWDCVFGTRWLPTDREPPVRTAIEALPRFPRTYAGLLAAPFPWQKLEDECGPRSPAAEPALRRDPGTVSALRHPRPMNSRRGAQSERTRRGS